MNQRLNSGIDKINIILLLICITFIFIGYFIMSQGDITVSPIILIIIYIIIIPLALLIKKKK